MSGPIVRSYGVPNWDEIFGGGADKAAEPKKKAKGKKAAKKPAPARAAAKPKKAAKKGARRK